VIRAILIRIAELLSVAFGVSVLTFLMIHLVPGDAAQVMLGASDVTPERVAALRQQLGLDRPLIVQYALWIGRALHGNFGASIWTGRPVIDEIAGRVGVTLELMLLGVSTATIIAIPAGCLMATLRSSTADYVLRVLSIAGITVPSFWLGTLLIYGAGAIAPGFQVVGWVPFADDPSANLQRMLLPTVALALPVLASLARVIRASMLESLSQEYVRVARAKGLHESRVIFRHALRNALIPFITTLGIAIGYQFGGAVVIEQVFALPGLGRLMVGAIAERNYPLIQAAILLATAGFVVVNFLVDLLYIAADPRTRQT
jgi:peptide/nickel transport system permease protein